MPKNQILTYVDAGASDWTAVLMRAVAHQLPTGSYEIRAVVADDIRFDSTLFDDAALFIMPGGADLPYCALLNGAPNARIRTYIEAGGNYLGICAGAYYACREIAFHAGTRGAICGSRELRLVNAAAVGSLPELTSGKLYDGTPGTAAAVRLRTTEALSPESIVVRSHYHGGCRFDFGGPVPAGTEVLATYADTNEVAPAIVAARVGLGTAVLTGVHLEISAEDFAEMLAAHPDSARHQEICGLLATDCNQRQNVFRQVLRRAGLVLNA
ncbi:BPL-N domain-containing protein [Cupriavidus agavae]|uniref:Glutamine amidotransferase-like uncharacterized protein n=1 Tax=Cupriavidus agavae TaxID=1001822 RepID=A0A4Q7SAX8_9BURK|nr:BPL-N domain-containing protein [Cupriavidus agavae]RZT42522.1 glutamine amidotransferase-like uncharacterized protein [Cupriavidus agavae]